MNDNISIQFLNQNPFSLVRVFLRPFGFNNLFRYINITHSRHEIRSENKKTIETKEEWTEEKEKNIPNKELGDEEKLEGLVVLRATKKQKRMSHSKGELRPTKKKVGSKVQCRKGVINKGSERKKLRKKWG